MNLMNVLVFLQVRSQYSDIFDYNNIQDFLFA